MAKENDDEIQTFYYCPDEQKMVPVKKKEEKTKAKAASTNQSEQDLIMNYIKDRKQKLVRFKHGGHYHGSIYGIKTDKQKFVPRKIHSSFSKVREDIANRKTLG